MGGWYFQSSLVELRTLVLHQQQDIAGHRSEILEQNTKVAEQTEIIRQLKEKLNEQNKQIDLILLELEEAQFQVNTDIFLFSIINTRLAFSCQNNIVHLHDGWAVKDPLKYFQQAS